MVLIRQKIKEIECIIDTDTGNIINAKTKEYLGNTYIDKRKY